MADETTSKVHLPDDLAEWAKERGLGACELWCSDIALALLFTLSGPVEEKDLREGLLHLAHTVISAAKKGDAPWPLVLIGGVDALNDKQQSEARNLLFCLANDSTWHNGHFSLYIAPIDAGPSWSGPKTAYELRDRLLDGSVSGDLPGYDPIHADHLKAALAGFTGPLVEQLTDALRVGRPTEPPDLSACVDAWARDLTRVAP